MSDWRTMESAPKNATWVEVDTGTRIVRAHWASNLSGEEQPPFEGWFEDKGSYFAAVFPSPIRWRPIVDVAE
jgi:hypothetical protein